MTDTLWYGLALLVVIVAAAAVWWWTRQPRRAAEAGPPPLPTEWDIVARPVFTADERRLYRQLREALPHHVILSKLPLVRFCQPNDPERVRYWYDLLGGTHVHFAVCSANGRVLAAIDMHDERGGPPSRAMRIKQSVLGACRVRYLRCPPDHLPSVPELQLLVPQQSPGSQRGPQPAQPAPRAAVPGAAGAAAWAAPVAAAPTVGSGGRRRERAATLWHDSLQFTDSFFLHDRRAMDPAGPDSGGLDSLMKNGTLAADDADVGMPGASVADGAGAAPMPRAR